MKIKTSDLIGTALDWAVAGAAGYSLSTLDLLYDVKSYNKFNPSTDWAHGGPIIEQNEIPTKRRMPCMKGEEWEASGSPGAKGAGYRHAYGPTPLIAAMRCYVAGKLGNEVEVPDELL